MTPDEYYAYKIDKLGGGDPESSHSDADQILCEILESLGYAQTVESFRKLEKWYA